MVEGAFLSAHLLVVVFHHLNVGSFQLELDAPCLNMPILQQSAID